MLNLRGWLPFSLACPGCAAMSGPNASLGQSNLRQSKGWQRATQHAPGRHLIAPSKEVCTPAPLLLRLGFANLDAEGCLQRHASKAWATLPGVATAASSMARCSLLSTLLAWNIASSTSSMRERTAGHMAYGYKGGLRATA